MYFVKANIWKVYTVKITINTDEALVSNATKIDIFSILPTQIKSGKKLFLQYNFDVKIKLGNCVKKSLFDHIFELFI